MFMYMYVCVAPVVPGGGPCVLADTVKQGPGGEAVHPAHGRVLPGKRDPAAARLPAAAAVVPAHVVLQHPRRVQHGGVRGLPPAAGAAVLRDMPHRLPPGPGERSRECGGGRVPGCPGARVPLGPDAVPAGVQLRTPGDGNCSGCIHILSVFICAPVCRPCGSVRTPRPPRCTRRSYTSTPGWGTRSRPWSCCSPRSGT